MNAKKILTAILLLFVVTAVGMVIFKAIGSKKTYESAAVENQLSQVQLNQEKPLNAENPTEAILQPNANVDVVYYFMTTQRCPSCMKIDSYTREAVKDHYSEKLANDTMMWKMVNVDEPQNNHFIKDYKLFTKSVVLVRYRGGKQVRWKNLDQVWNLLGNKTAFHNYIVREVDSFIEEG